MKGRGEPKLSLNIIVLHGCWTNLEWIEIRYKFNINLFKNIRININKAVHLFFCIVQANSYFLKFSLRIYSWLIYCISLRFSYIRNAFVDFKCSLMFFYPKSQVNSVQILLTVSQIHSWRLAIKTIIEHLGFDPSTVSMIVSRFSLPLQQKLYAKNKFISLPTQSKSIF